MSEQMFAEMDVSVLDTEQGTHKFGARGSPHRAFQCALVSVDYCCHCYKIRQVRVNGE